MVLHRGRLVTGPTQFMAEIVHRDPTSPMRPEKSRSLPVRLRRIMQDLASDAASIHVLTDDLRVNEGRMHDTLQRLRDGVDPVEELALWEQYDQLQAQRMALAALEQKRLQHEATVLTDRQVALYREQVVAAVLRAIDQVGLKTDQSERLRRLIYEDLVRQIAPGDR